MKPLRIYAMPPRSNGSTRKSLSKAGRSKATEGAVHLDRIVRSMAKRTGQPVQTVLASVERHLRDRAFIEACEAGLIQLERLSP